MSFLDNLLEQPEEKRRQVAFLATGIISLIVVSAWLFIASYNMKQAVAVRKKPTTSQAESFRKSLPQIKQTDSVQTELTRRRTKENNSTKVTD